MTWIRPIHRLLLMLFLLGGVTEFFLAGAGVFGADDFDPHRMLGSLLMLLALVIAVVALVGRTFIIESVALLLLMILQAYLASEDVADWVAAFHPVNGLLLLAVAGTTLRRSFAAVRERGGRPWQFRAHQHTAREAS